MVTFLDEILTSLVFKRFLRHGLDQRNRRNSVDLQLEPLGGRANSAYVSTHALPIVVCHRLNPNTHLGKAVIQSFVHTFADTAPEPVRFPPPGRIAAKVVLIEHDGKDILHNSIVSARANHTFVEISTPCKCLQGCDSLHHEVIAQVGAAGGSV